MKLSDELKARIVELARDEGVSAHAYMVAALDRAASAAERRAAFVAQAGAARADVLERGSGYAADDVHGYLRRRVADPKAKRPKRKAWSG